MWSRKRLDIGWSDLGAGAMRACLPSDRGRVAAVVEELFGGREHAMACLSVRSGFDLLLGALALPHGSEVLVSAMTIPDMVRIIREHGLVPVPVDLDPCRMAPRVEGWRRAVTPATKLILVAHLFGSRTEMAPVVDLARRHGLLIVEDCAQAFAGIEYPGHPEVDVSMFSFGTIKCSTALGGAVLRVRDGELLARMRLAQAAYPVQSRWAYQRRLAKCAVLKVLAGRVLYGMLVQIFRAIGWDYDRAINHSVRGFAGPKKGTVPICAKQSPGCSGGRRLEVGRRQSPFSAAGDDFFARIRRQASAPLLAVLQRRLQDYDSRRWESHKTKAKMLSATLQTRVACPTATVAPHTYWVFPILVDRPDQLIDHLARAGFDATQGHSLCVVAAPQRRAEATAAKNLLARMVFLPFYPELPPRESERLAAAVLTFVGQ